MPDASLGTAVLHAKLDTSAMRVGLQTAEREAEKSARNITDHLTGIGRRLQGIGAVMTVGITAPLAAMGVAGVKSAMQLETFAASLRVLIGDAERANKVFDQLYEFSANTPFDWRTLTEGTRVLAAFGVEAEDIVGTLSMLGDIASGTQSDLTRLAEIYGRVQVTGRLSMQEVNSLALAGVPIYTELAKVIGVSSDEVRELISTGRVGFPELNAVLRSLTSEGGQFFGMMDAQAETVAGRLNRLKDSFEQVTDVIGDRLLPAFDALISAGQKATDWFVNLDESTQGLFVGLGTTLAVSGPLLVGVGTLVTMLPKVAAGFGAVKLAMGPLFGPVGIAVTAIGVIAGLAIALSGREGSLDRAVDAAREAFNKGDSSSLVGALDEVAGKFEGEFKAALRRAQEELRLTGQVGVESANVIVRAMESALAQANLARLGVGIGFRPVQAALDQAGASMFGDDRIPNARERVEIALKVGNFAEAADIVGRALNLLSSSAPDSGAIDALREFHLELMRGTQRIKLAEFKPPEPGAPGGTTPPPPPPAGTGAGNLRAAAERTWEDVLADLDRSGTHAMRQAAFEGTDDAFRDAAQQRVRLINTAISELLSDPHYGLVPDWVLDDLRARREAAALEAGRVGVGVTPGVNILPAPAAASDMALRADQNRRATEAAASMNALRAQAVDALSGVGEGLQALVTRAKAATDAVVNARWGDTNSELERVTRNAASLTATLKASADQAEFSAGLQVFSDRQRGVFGRGSQFAVGPVQSDAAVANARVAVLDAVQAFHDGRGGIEAVEEAVDALTTLTPMTVKAINDLTGGIVRLAREAARVAEFDENAGQYGRPHLFKPIPKTLTPEQEAFGTWAGGIAHRPRPDNAQDLANAKRINEERQAAADKFNDTILQAGIGFASTLARGLQTGDIGSIVSGGFGAFGSIVGAIPGISTGLTIFSSLLPIIGDLFGGLIGGGNQDQERARERERRNSRSVPAITIHFQAHQVNNYQGGPAQPQNELAFRQQFGIMIDEFVRRTDLFGRLDRIEGAVG